MCRQFVVEMGRNAIRKEWDMILGSTLGNMKHEVGNT